MLEVLLFEDVLDLSLDRILQRIRPPWVEPPEHYRGVEEPLWVRMERMVKQITPSGGSTPYEDVLSRLKEFDSSVRDLEFRLEGARLRNTVRNVIRKCADTSYGGGHKSLEEQVILHGGTALVTKEVVQIDKLARYFGLCRDLSKLSQRCSFHDTAKGIMLQCLKAPQSEKPDGASKTCHIHAEVQLILYYEQHQTERPPRAIGCSKSACFLCDILIQKLQKYHISFSHRRLYNQWTIMDVCWMTTEQAHHFRDVLRAIITELLSLRQSLVAPCKRQLLHRKFGLESRAVLPLSSHSSLDDPLGKSIAPQPDSVTPMNQVLTSTKSPITVVANTTTASRQQREPDPIATSTHPAATLSRPSPPTTLDLCKTDLPHHRKIGSKAGICLKVGKMLLLFDCSAISAGSLSIRKVETNGTTDQKNETRRIRAMDIPTHNELLLRSGDSTKMVFRLHNGRTEVEVEIVWQ